MKIKKEEKTKMYSFRLPISLIKALKKFSKETGVSRTKILMRGAKMIMRNPELLNDEPLILKKKGGEKQLSGFLRLRLPVIGVPAGKNKTNYFIDEAKLIKEKNV